MRRFQMRCWSSLKTMFQCRSLLLILFSVVFVWVNLVGILMENQTVNGTQRKLETAADALQVITNVDQLAVLIDELNNEQFIWNSANNKGQKWSSTGQVGSIVIVIQVHNRAENLKKLIESLSRAKWINRTLLVFSHDIYSYELNQIVRSIPFAAGVVQIFYPYSIQLHPSSFPGQSPFDCPRDIGRKKAEKVNCPNYAHPDRYGHYREAKFCQPKHHWFWKANYIFNGHLRLLKDYDGPVLFLEEDHWLAEDFLHVLWLQQRLMSQYTNARMLSLGTYDFVNHQQPLSSQVDLVQLDNENLAMTFNRTFWREFQNCSNIYCSFDDYNFDFSLKQVSRRCLSDVLGVLILKAPRAFHLGQCGLHQHQSNNCDDISSSPTLKKALASLRLARENGSLYPENLQVIGNQLNPGFIRNTQEVHPNGGWADPRDRELCLSFSNFNK